MCHDSPQSHRERKSERGGKKREKRSKSEREEEKKKEKNIEIERERERKRDGMRQGEDMATTGESGWEHGGER